MAAPGTKGLWGPPDLDATQDHDVLPADALTPGEMTGILVGRWHVLILCTAGGLHALNDRCSHAAARLSPGRLRKGHVMCPLHGARFDPATGRCVSNPYFAVRTFPVRIEQGRVIVTLPARAPEMNEIPLN